MKKISLVLTAFLVGGWAQAQIASVEDSKILAGAILDAFNKGDGDAFIKLADPEFLNAMGEASLRGFAGSWKNAGQLMDPVLIHDVGEFRYFKFTIKKGEKSRETMMILGAGAKDKFFSLGLRGMPKPGKAPFTPKSDLTGSSPLDLAVKKATDFYYWQQQPVGTSIGILKDGRMSFYNFGETAVDSGVMPTKNSIYEIGSITKAFTGTMLARAVLDKKISLDDDIRRYLPKGFEHLHWEGTPVTVRHLSNHSSGLPSSPKSISSESLFNPWKPLTREQLFEDLRTDKMVAKPGEKVEYNNLAVGLLGHIIADRYKTTYESLLKDMILKPVGMKNSGIHLTPAQFGAFVNAHNGSRKQTSWWNVNGAEAAGAVRSDAEDMLKFASWVLDPKNKAAQLATTKTISAGPMLDLGLCWVLRKYRTVGRVYEHSGGTGGFTTQLVIAPDKKMAVVVLTNSFDSSPENLASDILFLASK